jgi:MatE
MAVLWSQQPTTEQETLVVVAASTMMNDSERYSTSGNGRDFAAVVDSEADHYQGESSAARSIIPSAETSWASRCRELAAVGSLAWPTVVVQMGTVWPGFWTASYIGRNFAVEYLDGFTLASLTINLFTLSLLQGLYSASDTLSPQAYGAGNASEVGHLAVRGYLGSLLVTVPSYMLLAHSLKPVLIYLGIDAEASTHASHYYLINGLGLPFNALFQVTWKFLSAQNVMTPLLVCILVSCGLVLPITLWTLGGWYGFAGAAVANVVFQIVLALSLVAYLWLFQPHDPATWPGLRASLVQALRWEPFQTYMVRRDVLNGTCGVRREHERARELCVYSPMAPCLAGTIDVGDGRNVGQLGMDLLGSLVLDHWNAGRGGSFGPYHTYASRDHFFHAALESGHCLVDSTRFDVASIC